MCPLITQEAPISDVLVLVPADQTVTVDVEVAPLALHAVVNVFLLSVLDPKLQLVLRHKIVFVAVDFIHDDAAETNTWLQDSEKKKQEVAPLCGCTETRRKLKARQKDRPAATLTNSNPDLTYDLP